MSFQITFDAKKDEGLCRIYAFEEEQARGASEEHDVYIEGVNIDGLSVKEWSDQVREEEVLKNFIIWSYEYVLQERKAAVCADVDVLDMYEDPTEEVDDIVSAAAEVVGEPLEAESIACPPPTSFAAHQLQQQFVIINRVSFFLFCQFFCTRRVGEVRALLFFYISSVSFLHI